MVENVDTLVVGSGVAGLATAIGVGPDTVVLEKRTLGGGLSSSVQIDGTIFDLGGHSFHTPHLDVKQLVYESCNMFEQVRVAQCYSHGELIPYPFQKNFDALSRQDVVNDCRNGLAQICAPPSLGTLDDYLRTKFGAGIANHFLVPYNRKLWGSDLKRISPDWVQERIYSGNSQEGRQMAGGARQPLNARTIVAYPAQGGFGEIANALASRVPRIRFNNEVSSIDLRQKLVRTGCGAAIRWQRLVSTMPLNRLVQIIDEAPEYLKGEVDKLEVLRLALIMVVLKGRLHTDVQRIYCADETTPAHKIVLNNNSSDYLRALPNHGVLGEVSLANREYDPTEIERLFVESLIQMGVLQNLDQVKSVRTITLDYGYPVITTKSREIVATAKDWLGNYEIYSVGRFGEYDYINSDEAILRGIRLGKSLAGEKCQSI